MPHCILYGKIVLYSEPTSAQMLDLAYYATQKAIDCRLGLNMYCNMSQNVLKYFNMAECARNHYIPYEILDDPLSNECCEIFDGISLPAPMIGIKDSRLPNLQVFINLILQHELISHITICFEDVHADKDIVYHDYEICSDELCDVLETIPYDLINRTEFPVVRFKIRRNSS